MLQRLFLSALICIAGAGSLDAQSGNPSKVTAEVASQTLAQGVRGNTTRNLIEPAASAPTASASEVAPQGTDDFDWKRWKITIVDKPFDMTYSRKGLQLQTHDGRFTSRIRWRMQSRWVTPYDSDPRRESQFGTEVDNQLSMRRARFKADGKMWGNLVNYNFEHDLVGNTVLNLYADINVTPWLTVRGGQWKSVFSSERAISSGSQQFVDRSIVNNEFTVDRQLGVSLSSHFLEGTLGDSTATVEILAGDGRWGGWQGGPMLVGRYQWNFLGKEVDPDGSDLDLVETPTAFVALNGMKNSSRFTRFSSSGGGQLDGFAAGSPNQYDLTQFNGEFMLKYRGLSIQNENHWKNVQDTVNGTSRNLRGTIAQAGYFPHAVWEPFPRELEFGYRWAQVDPNTAASSDLRYENSIVMNVFLEGHTNKFSVEAGRLSMDRPGLPGIGEWRYRVQWDVHF